jgi:acyl-CoA synthetase (AMP-forming)/AMP-acid ligase II
MTLKDRLGDPRYESSVVPAHHPGGRLSDVLNSMAKRSPDEPACVVLNGSGREAVRMTYGELDRRARATAAAMQHCAGPGDRALLVFPTDAHFLVAFFACEYAGIIAIPAPFPGEARTGGAQRLEGIIQDASPRLVLTTPEIADRPGDHGLGTVHPIAVDQVPAEMADQFQDPGVAPDAFPAFLQYTSGSTSEPRGVQISYRNLLANLADIKATIPVALPENDTVRIVSWLPLFHDMGLANALLSLFMGGLIVLISPVSFLLRPALWLEAITRYRAHLSTGPNFAYELCAHRVTDDQRSKLDLSSWRYALNGSERVRSDTLDDFARAFAVAGFDPEAFVSCYGLAEATCYVSGARGAARKLTASVPALVRDSVVRAPEDGEPSYQVVSCGPVAAGLDVRIVDSGTRREQPPGRVGEIWIAGDSISRGYWQRTDERFFAHLADGAAGPFLRTGDLGFLDGGELYVLGRHDDVIVLDGQNHYPYDIELTAQQSHPALESGRVAAFGYPDNDRIAVAVVAETARRVRIAAAGSAPRPGEVDHAEVVRAVRAAVAEQHHIRVTQVVLVHPAGLPKTTSGKIRRGHCRELFLTGGLKTWRVGPYALRSPNHTGPTAIPPTELSE